MTIKLQDRSLLVQYLQVYLRDLFGVTVVKNEGKYSISQNPSIKITGVFDEATYLSLGLFMTYNYPNEKFPSRYDIDDDNKLISTPFDMQKLIRTLILLQQNNFNISDEPTNEDDYNRLIRSVTVSPSIPGEEEDVGIHYVFINPHSYLYPSPVSLSGKFIRNFSSNNQIYGEILKRVVNSRVKVELYTYNEAGQRVYLTETSENGSTRVVEGWIKPDNNSVGLYLFDDNSNPENYLSYSELLRYFDTPTRLNEVLSSDNFSQNLTIECLSTFMFHNISLSSSKPLAAHIDSRVLSYILEEVVTPTSSPDEIMRVQQIIYPHGLNYQDVGVFENLSHNFNMTQKIKDIQKEFIDRCTTVSDSLELTYHFPQGFKDFKVTGYVDPWTEVILKGGNE